MIIVLSTKTGDGSVRVEKRERKENVCMSMRRMTIMQQMLSKVIRKMSMHKYYTAIQLIFGYQDCLGDGCRGIYEYEYGHRPNGKERFEVGCRDEDRNW